MRRPLLLTICMLTGICSLAYGQKPALSTGSLTAAMVLHGGINRLATKATPEITPPAPEASGLIKACVGTASAAPSVQTISVSGKDLTAGITATCSVTDFELALAPNGPYSDMVIIPAIAGVVNNATVYIRSSASAPIGKISGAVWLNSPSAQQHAVGVTGQIGGAARVDKIPQLYLQNGQNTPGIALTGTGNVFSWTIDNTTIGLPAAGKGTIPAFKAVNTGTTSVTATITMVPKSLPLLKVVTASNSLFTSINTLNDQEENRFTSKWKAISSIAIGPNGKQIYAVLDTAFGNLLGYHTGSDTLYSAITSGSGSNKVVISPDGAKAFVTMKGDAFNHQTAVVLNVASAPFTRDGYINLNVTPTTEAISADGKRLYVVSKQPDAVTQVNTGNYADFKTIITSGLIASPNSAIVSPDDRKLFVAGVGVSVIDQASQSIIRNFATGIIVGDIAISPDSKTLYVSEPSANRVLKFDVNTGAQLGDITVGKSPKALAITGDGSQLFVANTGETSVSVIDLAGFTFNRNITTPGTPSYIALVDGTACPGIPEEYRITVTPTPKFTATGALSALETEYGTTSQPSSFTLSGVNIGQTVTITAPNGFSASVNGLPYSNQVIFPGTWLANPIKISIRLNSNADAGTYQGDINIHSGDAGDLNIPMPLSTVRPALLTIKANDKPKVYGESLNTPLLGTNNYTILAGSLKNGNTITSVVITYGTGRNADDDVASYYQSVNIIDIIGSNGFLTRNYNIGTIQPGNINVSKAVLSIKADPMTKPYGTTLSNGTITSGFTVTGLQNQQTIASVQVVYTDGAAANAAIKTYPNAITISGAAGGTFKPGNYTVNTYLPGDLTVTAPTITVTVNNATRDRGKDNPAFTATYTGFINTDNISVIKTLPRFSTTATRTSLPGIYPITASGAVADNYIFKYVEGQLTVTAPTVATLKIPNTITPNGDGINDSWEIGNIYAYPNCTVNIYTRNGSQVFTSVGYNTPWNGTHKGRNLNAGTYYYLIRLDAMEQPLSGSITLLR